MITAVCKHAMTITLRLLVRYDDVQTVWVCVLNVLRHLVFGDDEVLSEQWTFLGHSIACVSGTSSHDLCHVISGRIDRKDSDDWTRRWRVRCLYEERTWFVLHYEQLPQRFYKLKNLRRRYMNSASNLLIFCHGTTKNSPLGWTSGTQNHEVLITSFPYPLIKLVGGYWLVLSLTTFCPHFPLTVYGQEAHYSWVGKGGAEDQE